jgi:hypothetical protein
MGLFNRLLHGSDPAKISPIWRLLSNIKFSKSLLHNHLVLIPSHVHREANKVADNMANIDVDRGDFDLDCKSLLSHEDPTLMECINMENKEDSTQNGVSSV